ncbi:MAG TPA: ATP-binding protein [Magnetospirillaceae bacterium]|nr:ATP-binding protein [Magnetospirillaceae bacterium]
MQLISIAVAVLLGIIVVTRAPKDRNRWLLLVFNCTVAVWILSGIYADIPGDGALFWNRIVFIAGLLTCFAGYIVIASLANRLNTWSTVLGVLLGAWCLTILMTPLVVPDVAPRVVGGSIEGVNALHGSAYLLYVVSLLGGGGGVVAYAFYRMKKSSGRFRSQLTIIATGFVGVLIGGVLLGVALPLALNSSAPANFAFLNAFIAIAAFTYAIVQQRLFDLRLALARSFGYFLGLAAMAVFYVFGVFGLADALFHSSTSDIGLRIYYVGAALFVALTFRPLRNFFSKLTRRIFFRDSYETEEVFSTLTTSLVGTVNLKALTRTASDILKDATKVEFLQVITSKFGKENPELFKTIQNLKDPLVVIDELAAQHKSAADQLSEAHIALVSRLRTHKEVVGYLICGQKIRGDALTSQDIDLIRIASDELAVAVQNALRFEEISRFNVTLKEEVDDATGQLRASNRKLHMLDEAKDEFISMASHQLRTPLTSVKGYLSMVLEGDAGNITPEQRKLLEEAYGSSQRMVYLIGDFLNVSRLQTGKFVLESAPVNLAHLVGDEVEQLKATAARRAITLVFHAPSQFPEVSIDDGKIRQVIMNFIDNAIFYSKPNSTVTVELTATGRDITLAVHDTGIGVPSSERHHLFTKFYRATNARKVRPDGTGIGLYMAKKVVTAHGGSIIFETKENQGSTFGFRLPLKHDVK